MVKRLEAIDVEKSEVSESYTGPIQQVEAKRVQPVNIENLKVYYQAFGDVIPNSTINHQA